LVTLINFAYSTSELTNALRSTDILPKLVTNIPSLVRIVLLHDIACKFEKLISSPFFVEYRDVVQLGRQRTINSAAYGSKVSCMDILNLQFTSGSTGAPKAAALTHSGMMNSARYISLQMKVDRGDKIVVPVPLFHAFGLIIGEMLAPFFWYIMRTELFAGLCTAFVAGASAVLPSEYFEAGAVLKAVEKYACTGLYGVTTMFIDELAHPEFSSMKRSSLR
jgi:acyl-CoA synthetase (AMP-forming)/AMP-acid ligase II